MLKRLIIGLAPLAILVAIPLMLQPADVQKQTEAERIIVLTPHNEAIRFEFGHAFSEHCKEKHGRTVEIDWRAPGGTSEIVRFIDDQYVSAFRRYWLDQGREWTREVHKSFDDRRFNEETATSLERQAHSEFLASEIGIGIDLFFGGGEYYMRQQAAKGHGVDAGLLEKHREWFSEDAIPASFSGEHFYDPKGRYYGTCLSAFGICYNPERLKLLPALPPTSWEDIGHPNYYRNVGVADPTKSGSITKCFEMLVQQQMAEELALLPANASEEDRMAALSAGWDNGFNLIKRIGGNARYITDSAGKIPRDVSSGAAAAGMCIDFYGRSQADWSEYQSGGEGSRIQYVTPRGGSSISVDPVLLLRGAPNRELAIMFMEFVLSQEGQRLWNYRPGEPGGPQKYALRRLPIRRDVYTDADRAHMSDGDQKPFADAAGFSYDGSLTGPYFGMIRTMIKIIIIDTREDLISAWGAIAEAGGPEDVPDAMNAFNALPFSYQEAAEFADLLRNGTPEESLALQGRWGAFFRENFTAAEMMVDSNFARTR